MYALNLKHSLEKFLFWERADPFIRGAGHVGRALMTSADRHPGVKDGIELHNGRQATRRAASKGSWGMEVPEYGRQCEKRWSKGRVASDGDRYATVVSDEVG